MADNGIKTVAVIGAGISGMTVGHLLGESCKVTLFEKAEKPGGLIKCERISGSLFHTCGGHVFNTKRGDVAAYFWSFFNREDEFQKADRNSVVYMADGLKIPYPIEDHAYLFDDLTLGSIIADVISLGRDESEIRNFEEFLKRRFGRTLYELYFEPYNSKIWRRDLSSVPISWLEGKLPMPSPEEIVFNNIRRVEEKQFVHSTFWYEKQGGSQFLADRLAEGLDIRCGVEVKRIGRDGAGWLVDGQPFDRVVFCGNIKDLPAMLGDEMPGCGDGIERLEYHGTTTVFCEIDRNPYSWIYLPDRSYDAHRIICTGNFSASNNAPGKMTGTVEFTDHVDEAEIRRQLALMPLSPKYIAHKFNPLTYPIQDSGTRAMIASVKADLAGKGFYMTGRFADWEYYNMDVAMGAAMDLVKSMD